MRLTVRTPAGFRLETTARSHGWYDLPPFSWSDGRLATAAHAAGAVWDLAIVERDGALLVTAESSAAGPDAEPPAAAKAEARARLRAMVTSMLRLDEELQPLYALTDGDPKIDYARAAAAGRLLRAPTAFEDVIKMLLTTNCSWSLTRIMVTRLVDELGAAAPSGRKAFPTAAAMARKRDGFYRDTVRAGYRAPHLAAIARAVASGELDCEAWRTHGGDDEEVRDELLALPGIGPYAADNLMRLCGRYAYLGLDSWCRGKLKQLYPRVRDVDAFAHKRYRPYGKFAGLAMWLELTRAWHDRAPDAPPDAGA